MNVDQRQGQLNALGMAEPLIQLVKNVVLLIVMKPAVIMGLTLAQTVAAAHVNVAHQPPPPALQAAVVPAVVPEEVVVEENGEAPVITLQNRIHVAGW